MFTSRGVLKAFYGFMLCIASIDHRCDATQLEAAFMNFWLECRSTLRVISARPYKENSLAPLRVSRRHFYWLSMMLWCSMICYGQERMTHQTSATLQFAMYATLAGSSLLRKLKTRPARLPDTRRANKSEFPVRWLQHYHESRQQFPTPCNQG